MLLAQGVRVLAGRAHVFAGDRDVGLAQRLIRISQRQQRGIVRRDADRQRAAMALHGFEFPGAQAEYAGQLRLGADAVAHLPAPVGPVLARGISKEALTEGARLLVFREVVVAVEKAFLAGGRRRFRPQARTADDRLY